MEELIIDLICRYGYLGIFLLIALENIFPPIPSEVILTFAGFMTISTTMNMYGVVAVATAGSLLGALILYCVGRLLDANRLRLFTRSKPGKLLRLKETDIIKAEDWFLKHGNKTVLFCRCIPIVRSLISVPAGMARMSRTPFFLYTLVGTLIWNTVLIGAGMLLGAAWVQFAEIIDGYSLIAVFVCVVAAAVVAVIYARNRFVKKDNALKHY